MRRLIDADLLMRKCEKWLKPKAPDEDEMVSLTNIAVSMLMEIEEQPTAFDVEKVIEQIETLRLKTTNIPCPDVECERCMYSDICIDASYADVHALDSAIEIIKRGGRDEE